MAAISLAVMEVRGGAGGAGVPPDVKAASLAELVSDAVVMGMIF